MIGGGEADLYALAQTVAFERVYGGAEWDAALRLLRGEGADWSDPASQALVDGLLDSAVALGTALRLSEAARSRPVFGAWREQDRAGHAERMARRARLAMDEHVARYSEFLREMALERERDSRARRGAGSPPAGA